MKLHLGTIGDTSLHFLLNHYVAPPNPLAMDQMVDMKNHYIMMIHIASSLNYFKFGEVNDFPTTYDIWNKLEKVYGGDDNVKRAKEKCLGGQFDQMKMKEDDNIAKCNKRIKEISAIRDTRRKIDDTIVVNKVLRNLLPIYAIRVSAIQEM